MFQSLFFIINMCESYKILEQYFLLIECLDLHSSSYLTGFMLVLMPDSFNILVTTIGVPCNASCILETHSATMGKSG